MKHLRDEQIQAYVDRTVADDLAAITQHLDSCAVCRAEAERYRRLVTALADETGIALRPGFAAATAAKLAAEEGTVPSRQSIIDLLPPVSAACLVLAVTIYLGGLSAVGSAFSSVYGWARDYIGALWAKSAVTTPFAHGSLDLVAAILLVLGFIVVLDKLVLHRRSSRTLFLA